MAHTAVAVFSRMALTPFSYNNNNIYAYRRDIGRMSCARVYVWGISTLTHAHVPYMVRSPLSILCGCTRPTQQRQSARLDLRLQLLIQDCVIPRTSWSVYSPPARRTPTFNYSPPHIFRRWRSILAMYECFKLFTPFVRVFAPPRLILYNICR